MWVFRLNDADTPLFRFDRKGLKLPSLRRTSSQDQVLGKGQKSSFSRKNLVFFPQRETPPWSVEVPQRLFSSPPKEDRPTPRRDCALPLSLTSILLRNETPFILLRKPGAFLKEDPFSDTARVFVEGN